MEGREMEMKLEGKTPLLLNNLNPSNNEKIWKENTPIIPPLPFPSFQKYYSNIVFIMYVE